MTYRNKKLRDSARDENCSNCNEGSGTVVWAHCNEQLAGKGMGEKGHDLIGAYLCQSCHDLYDGRIGGLPRSAKIELFNEAFKRTMIRVARKLEAGELTL